MFDMIDNMTKPLKNMLAGSKGMSTAIKESREQLAALNREQKKLDGFRDLKRGIKASSVEMQHAGDRARQLRLQLDALEGPARRKFENASQLKAARAEFDRTAKVMQTMNRLTGNKSGASVLAAEYRQLVAEQLKARQEIKRLEAEQKKLASQTPINANQLRALRQQYDAATRASDKLRQAHVEKLRSLRDARAGLTAAGISTRHLAEHERTLRANIVQTTAAMQTQTRQLEVMAEREKKLGAARGKMQALQGVAGGMAIGGYAAKSAGAGVLGGLGGTLDEAKKAQNEIARIQALGLGEQSTRDAEKFARGMKVHGSSYTDNLTMMRDSMTIFADEHHAQMAAPILSQMKFANEAMDRCRASGMLASPCRRRRHRITMTSMTAANRRQGSAISSEWRQMCLAPLKTGSCQRRSSRGRTCESFFGSTDTAARVRRPTREFRRASRQVWTDRARSSIRQGFRQQELDLPLAKRLPRLHAVATIRPDATGSASDRQCNCERFACNTGAFRQFGGW
ncbi:hypothetical protein WS91_30045 [Burkholderia sp. MSMB1498]|nr:hypothetical protein WS91_30045 [Burkholderia sp. MSMB1498]